MRILFTLAEEVGFVGAIGAAQSGTAPRGSRLICLEASKASDYAPHGAGPIVRVGDRTSTFTPELTFAVSAIAAAVAKKVAQAGHAGDESEDSQGGEAIFPWQRRLMDGGTCEASAFHALGYAATCICLPLGHYHNMDESSASIAPEFIHVRDYLGLVTLLVGVATRLDRPDGHQPFDQRLAHLFTQRAAILESDFRMV